MPFGYPKVFLYIMLRYNIMVSVGRNRIFTNKNNHVSEWYLRKLVRSRGILYQDKSTKDIGEESTHYRQIKKNVRCEKSTKGYHGNIM